MMTDVFTYCYRHINGLKIFEQTDWNNKQSSVGGCKDHREAVIRDGTDQPAHVVVGKIVCFSFQKFWRDLAMAAMVRLVFRNR
jgi:hypothetical protein